MYSSIILLRYYSLEIFGTAYNMLPQCHMSAYFKTNIFSVVIIVYRVSVNQITHCFSRLKTSPSFRVHTYKNSFILTM